MQYDLADAGYDVHEINDLPHIFEVDLEPELAHCYRWVETRVESANDQQDRVLVRSL